MANKAFLALLREDLSPQEWGDAVKIARTQHVYSIVGEDDAYLVQDPRTQMACKVKLWPADEDWLCSRCQSGACVHAAAAAIAVANQSLAPAESQTESAQLFYVLTPTPWPDGKTYLLLRREITKGQERLGVVGRDILVWRSQCLIDDHDLEIDRFFARHESSKLERGFWLQIWPLLQQREIYLAISEGQKKPIQLAKERYGYAIRCDAMGGAIRLHLEAQPVEASYANGLVVYQDQVFLAARLEDVPQGAQYAKQGRLFSQLQRDQLESEILPELRKFFPVADLGPLREAQGTLPMSLMIHSRWLDQTASEQDPSALEIHGEILYGQPPQAKLTPEGFRNLGPVPCKRNPQRESQLTAEYEQLTGRKFFALAKLRPEEVMGLREKLRSEPHHVSSQGRLLEQSQDLGFMQVKPVWNENLANWDFELQLPDRETQTLSWSKFQKTVQSSAMGMDWLGGGIARWPSEWQEEGRLKQLRDLLRSKSTPQGLAKVPMAQRLAVVGLLSQHDTRSAEVTRNLPPGILEDCLKAVSAIDYCQLRAYQKIGVTLLLAMRRMGMGMLLADEMGLGKTVQALCVLQGKCLIVAPASLVYNWGEELKRFRPQIPVTVYHGADRRLELSSDAATQVCLTSYATLRLDENVLSAVSWDMIVADEASAIKNPESVTAQAMKRVPASWRLALTGTPIENHVGDLLSILDFVDPAQAWLENGPKGLEMAAWKQRVEPHIIRRTKKEVLQDLPERTDILLHLTHSPAEQKAYQGTLTLIRQGLAQDSRPGMGKLLGWLTTLRRVACDYRVTMSKDVSKEVSQDVAQDLPCKIAYLLEQVPSLVEQGNSLIVVSQWTSMLDRLGADFAALGLDYLQFDGRTKDRGEVLRAFQERKSPILLLSLKAGGFGLNLTAASHLFLLDPWWNTAAQEQAMARIHRLGQKQAVFTYRMVAAGTIEDQVMAFQSAKAQQIAEVLENPDQAQMPEGMTEEELMGLLRESIGI